MIVPSIDLEDGQAVQLVGGAVRVLDAGDPRPLATRFGRVGEIAVVDLDAALGRGTNRSTILDLVARARCRVGGGIRSAPDAIAWLDAGASRVVLGTAARPDVLRLLPRERVVVALDALHGEVVVDGWRTRTGHGVEERMGALAGLAGEFLVTFVEREGRLAGVDLEACAGLARAARAAGAALTIAGGVTTAAEIAALDRLGVDAQVGMALYTGRLGLAAAFAAPLASDRADGLWPTVVTDERGVALGLAWSSLASLEVALEQGVGAYHSRERGPWIKGATSGATQALLSVALDCDRDALRFTVRQEEPGFCHRATRTCWGPEAGLGALARRVAGRTVGAPPGSYSARLLGDAGLLSAKLREEAGELAAAVAAGDVAHEAADVFYLATVALARAGVPLAAVDAELDRRA
ncbi:MAG: phosphoribosyl-ATP diphosphatase, partial [Candidatus Eisenbacteria bacterium]